MCTFFMLAFQFVVFALPLLVTKNGHSRLYFTKELYAILLYVIVAVGKTITIVFHEFKGAAVTREGINVKMFSFGHC